VFVYPWDDTSSRIKRIAEFADAGYKVAIACFSVFVSLFMDL